MSQSRTVAFAFHRPTKSAVDGHEFSSTTEARAAFVAHLPARCEVCRFEPPVLSDWQGDHGQFDIHHIVPRRHGGGEYIGNLVMLCANCHRMADDTSDDLGQPRHRSEFIEDFRLAYRDPEAFVLLTRSRGAATRRSA